MLDTNNTTRTEAQREASKINGSHSQGPTTPEGKTKSSMNAMKHGFRSSVVVLVNESQEKYDALLARYKRICNPVGQLEYDQLVHIVDAQWRIRRCKAMATRTLDMEMFMITSEINAAFDNMNAPSRQAQAVMSMSVGNPVSLLYFDRQEERLIRLYDRALATLLKLQTIRLGAKPTFNVDETNEPDTDENNCGEEEVFTYFMRDHGMINKRNSPNYNPNFQMPIVLTDPSFSQEPAA